MIVSHYNQSSAVFAHRTGSKLGISPLMLAAMNGHTTTVKLLLDMGSDINAQVSHMTCTPISRILVISLKGMTLLGGEWEGH